MNLATKTIAAFGLAALASGAANAAIVTGDVTGGSSGGAFVELNPTVASPLTVGNDNFNDPNLYAFNERQNVTLTSAIGGIAAGTIVSSHYVFFDPVNRPASTVIGNVTFDGTILAVLTSTSALAATDALFSAPNVTYLNPTNRGLEGADALSFANQTVSVDFRATTPGDYVRVITAAVPEPATWAMMLLGFFGIGFAMRRDRAQVRSTKVSFA